MLKFTITSTDKDSKARTACLELPHGKVLTPAFMPVGTNATVKAIELSIIEEMDINLILANAYHLYLRPGIDVIKNAGNLHSFMCWPHNILTDSGGFQIFSLAPFRKIEEQGIHFKSHIDGSSHFLTPERVVMMQFELGSDIIMPLDICTEVGITEEQAEQAVKTTTAWAKRSKKKWQELNPDFGGSLFAIVQGNFFKALRKQSAYELAELNLPGYALGGLSVGEEPNKFLEYLDYTSAFMPREKPRYLMGVGTPQYILEAVQRGIDLFDCVFPTRTARHALVFSAKGAINLRNEKYKLDTKPIDPACICTTCSKHTRSYLRHLFKSKEILAAILTTRHNLFFIQDLIKKIRDAIDSFCFLDFKKQFLNKYNSEVLGRDQI